VWVTEPDIGGVTPMMGSKTPMVGGATPKIGVWVGRWRWAGGGDGCNHIVVADTLCALVYVAAFHTKQCTPHAAQPWRLRPPQAGRRRCTAGAGQRR